MHIGTKSKMSTFSIMRKCAKFGRNNGRFVILAVLLACGFVSAPPVSASPVSEGGPGDLLQLIEVHTGTAARADEPGLLSDVIIDGVSPNIMPYGVVQEDQFGQSGEYGIALQLTPLAAGREIRWETTSEAPVASTSDNTRPHVWVKIEPKSGNSSFFLVFVIALFTISATGVMMMWRQIGKPDEAERPGWERWRH